MTLKTRLALEALFKNGSRPSQEDFADLIRSCLNRRDDQFMGRWRAGTLYRTGDVVIYGRALWELKPGPDGQPQEICAKEPPKEGPHWQTLIVPVEDGDWFWEGGEPPGADDPGANASGADDPDHPEPDAYAALYANPRVRRVGIGTDTPLALLDVTDAYQTRLLFGPTHKHDPTLVVVHLDPGGEADYLAAGLSADRAVFLSDAPDGFVFSRGDNYAVFCDHADLDHGQALVVIKPDGRVGMGTETPYTRLEVTNARSGRFLFNLDRKVNPALGIVNQRPGTRENYLTVGVDNDAAILVTDSEYGFVFRHGGESGHDDHEIDINQGKELVTIRPEGRGKLGIGRQPGDYQADVHGLLRAFGCYVDTDERHLARVSDLGSVLERLQELRPKTYRWRADTGLKDEGTQIGLLAHEVDDVFPEAVKTNHDRSKAVAYHNLVPVLIKAVQEQQAMIEALQQRLDALEDRRD